MAGTYATDLTHLWTTQNGPTEVSGAGSNIIEMTGYTAGGGNNRRNGDGDLYLSGGTGLTTNGATASGSSVSLVLDYVSDGRTQVTATAGNIFAFWSFVPTPTGIDTIGGATSGFAGEQICLGSAAGSYRSYSVGGQDVDLFGGWNHRTVDSRNAGTGDSRGTYTANNPSLVGWLYEQVVTLRRPAVLGMDNLRYGRHTFSCTGGTLTSIDNNNPLSSTAANFSQAADYNDYDGGATPSNGTAESGGYHKFGQFQGENIPGDKGFRLKGILSLGTSLSAVNFNSANDNITISDEFLTYADFTRIEFRNANSNITITNLTCNFTIRDSRIVAGDAPATTRGNVESFDNPTVLKLDGCSFNDMGTFIFQSNADLDDTTFRRCDQVTQGGGSFANCDFLQTRTDTALISTITTANNIDGCNFVGDGTSHAVDFGNVTSANNPGTITWNSTFDSSTYATANVNGTASTSGDSEVILLNVDSGETLTINVQTPTLPSYRNEGAGTVVLQQAFNLNITGLLGNTEVRVYNNPSLFTGGASSTEVTGVETVAAVTQTNTGSNYIFYAEDITPNVTQIQRFGTGVDFTTIGLVSGDKIRVVVRDNADNPTLQLFDEFEVDGTVTSTLIPVVDVPSSSTKFSSVIGSTTNSKTVTIEKVNATQTFSVTSGTYDVFVYRIGSLPIITKSFEVTENSRIPISQAGDRVYNNPA